MDESTIFTTERLIIRKLDPNDIDASYAMMSNPNVMNPIPQEVMSREESDANFRKHLNPDPDSTTKVWAVDSKEGDRFIGIAAFLKNDNQEDEIGYRLQEQFWKKGYGTEIAKGLIDYGFDQLNMELITADVNIVNHNSVKILDKFFTREGEFYNPNDKCTDRRYRLKKEDWMF